MKTLLHLKARTECHFPMGRAADGSRLFCAGPVVPNENSVPYCERHLAMAYQRTRKLTTRTTNHLAKMEARSGAADLDLEPALGKIAA